MIKLSLIIPCYNASRFLAKCLNSFVPQLTDEIEIICVNDGSKDNTAEIISEYSKKYPQIIGVNQSNGGSAAARNNGFSKAHGEYIWYFDADDTTPDDSFKTIIKEMDNSDVDCLIFGLEQIDEMDNKVVEYKTEYSTTGVVTGYEAYLRESIPSFPWNRAFRRDFLEKHKLDFRTIRPDDEEFDLRTYMFARKVKFINKCLYSYRIVSMSDSRNPNVFLKYLDGYKTIMYQHLEYANECDATNEFWCKVSFHCYKNMLSKIAGYELMSGEKYDARVLFNDIRALLDKQIVRYKCDSKFYTLLKVFRFSPCMGRTMFNMLYKTKKRLCK